MTRIQIELAFARAVMALPPPVLRAIFGPQQTSPEGYRLDQQTQALLTLSRITRQPDVGDMGVRKAREYLETVGPAFDAMPTDVSARDIIIPCATETRRARVLTPHGAGAASPGLVYFHGGGFTIGSIDSHDRAARGLASKARAVVVNVDYRLAPEHVFPAAVDDAVAATRWVLANAGSIGIDPNAVAVGGDSAGGTLAAVVAQTLRGEARQPAYQVLLYPVTDARGGTPSRESFRDGYFLTKRTIDFYLTTYIPDASQYTDPRASPILARDLSGLPPAFVLTAGFDPLRDEGRDYADKMRAAGVDVTYVCSEGSMHGFLNMAGAVHEAARILDLTGSQVQRSLASQRVASAA